MAESSVQSGSPTEQPTEELTPAANTILDANPELEIDPEMKIRYNVGAYRLCCARMLFS